MPTVHVASPPDTAACRQTQLFQFADSQGVTGTAVPGDGVRSTKWLTDFSCESGDAGGLPGYPVISYAASTDPTYGIAGTGYCTDKASATSVACATAAGSCDQTCCSVQGTCPSAATHVFYGDATVAGECGVCAVSASNSQSSATAYPQTER